MTHPHPKRSFVPQAVLTRSWKLSTASVAVNTVRPVNTANTKAVNIVRPVNTANTKAVINYCQKPGIKREFSVARTPQQNGVAERKNRTQIEAVRTMLVDSKLPTTYWAKVVNTACYVLNMVLVIKPHNKKTYELIRERPLLIDFMKPFGCPVTILNTKDHLGKFDGKADEGYFVGYYVVSKAMRVFNKRTRIVEETLNIRFLENTPNVKGNGPDWLFNVDSLSISMNYVPVAAGNKTNGIARNKDNIVVGQGQKEKEPEQDYILIPLCTTDPLISQGARSESERLNQSEMQTEHTNSSNGINTITTPVSTAGPSFDTAVPSTPINTVGPSVSTANESEEQLFERISPFKNAFSLLPVPNISSMDNTGIFGNAYDDEDMEEEVDMNNVISSYTVPYTSFTKFHKDHPEDQVIGRDKWAIGTKWVFRNKKDKRGIVVKNKARVVAQGHTQEEGIDYDEVFSPVARIKAIRLFLAYASFKDFAVYQMDVKSGFLYGKIEEEVYVCQPPGFEDPHFPDKFYKVENALYGLHQALRAWYETLSTYLLDNGFHRGQIDKTLYIKRHKDDILLVQVYVDDIIFGSTKKHMSNEFEKLMHDKFQMSSMGELSFFLELQTISTPMETNKALVKDKEVEDVDVQLYRSMIGSLMYLTASRPDIIFVVCACARFLVTPKTSHFNAVKRIFRYLKGQPKLGLWYPRDSPFDLEAFFDSDYAGSSLDKKSTTGGYQSLGKRLISWQCKKQTIVLWIQNQMLDYGFNFMNTEIYIDNESTICIVKNLVSHSKTKHIEIRHHFIRDSYKKKLIQVNKIHTDQNVEDLLTKAFDVGDEAVHKELGDRMERATTTASSLEAEQDNSQTRFETTSIQSNDLPLSKVNTFGSGEDSLKLMKLMAHCTKLCKFVRKRNREKCHIYYAITECPTLYLSLIEQFLQTVALSTTEDGVHAITATINGRDKIITEVSIRRHLKLQDLKGLSSLPNAEIFEQLARIRITSSPSLSSHHTPLSTPNTPPSFQTTHKVEETATMPYDSPLPRGHTLGSDEGKLKHDELMELVTKFEEIREISQGRKIAQIDTDPTISLVHDEGTSWFQEDVETQEKNSADIEVLLEEETPTELIEDLGSEVSTASHDVSTTTASLVYIRRSASKEKDKGKDIMQEPEPLKKLKKRVQVQMSVDEELARKNWSLLVAEVRMNIEDKEKGSKKKAGGSRKKTLAKKRAGEKQSDQSAKRQKTEYDSEMEELKTYLDIVLGEEFDMDFESLATKFPIVDLKTHVLAENFMYYQIFRAVGSSKIYKILVRCW
ncbi:putative ribonuclease H-like domain-containing protein [Tanacetum coccineum]